MEKIYNESDFHMMPAEPYSTRSQIPIRKSRFLYLTNNYKNSEENKWVMFCHSDGFFIYDKESRDCVFKAHYMEFQKGDNVCEQDPIIAVIDRMEINTSEEDASRGFELLAKLIEKDL